MTTAAPPQFKRVPFNPAWVTESKLDLHAIYRRPRYVRGAYDEIVRATEGGVPAWDLTGPLPVRRHSDWAAKGYEYVTLADRGSLLLAAPGLRGMGHNPAEYDQHPEFGPWNPKLFEATQRQVDQDQYAALRALVQQYGSETVISIKRASEPAFELPAELRGIPPGGQVAEPEPEAAAVAKGSRK